MSKWVTEMFEQLGTFDLQARLLLECSGTERQKKVCKLVRTKQLSAEGLNILLERSGFLIPTGELMNSAIDVNNVEMFRDVAQRCKHGFNVATYLLQKAVQYDEHNLMKAAFQRGVVSQLWRYGISVHHLWNKYDLPFNRAVLHCALKMWDLESTEQLSDVEIIERQWLHLPADYWSNVLKNFSEFSSMEVPGPSLMFDTLGCRHTFSSFLKTECGQQVVFWCRRYLAQKFYRRWQACQFVNKKSVDTLMEMATIWTQLILNRNPSETSTKKLMAMVSGYPRSSIASRMCVVFVNALFFYKHALVGQNWSDMYDGFASWTINFDDASYTFCKGVVAKAAASKGIQEVFYVGLKHLNVKIIVAVLGTFNVPYMFLLRALGVADQLRKLPTLTSSEYKQVFVIFVVLLLASRRFEVLEESETFCGSTSADVLAFVALTQSLSSDMCFDMVRSQSIRPNILIPAAHQCRDLRLDFASRALRCKSLLSAPFNKLVEKLKGFVLTEEERDKLTLFVWCLKKANVKDVAGNKLTLPSELHREILNFVERPKSVENYALLQSFNRRHVRDNIFY